MRVIDGLILYALRLGTWFVIGAVLGFGLGWCSAAKAGPLNDVALYLQIGEGGCSGTAISRHVVLTASHCFSATTKAITIAGRPANIVGVVADGKDHSLVRLDIEFKAWARVGPAPKQGDVLRWIGAPGGRVNFYREGYVSNIDDAGVYIDAPSFQGDSGAGLFNARGQLVGVISGSIIWWSLEDQSRMQLSRALPLAFTPEQWAATL